MYLCRTDELTNRTDELTKFKYSIGRKIGIESRFFHPFPSPVDKVVHFEGNSLKTTKRKLIIIASRIVQITKKKTEKG